jgi:hypothetical protein
MDSWGRHLLPPSGALAFQGKESSVNGNKSSSSGSVNGSEICSSSSLYADEKRYISRFGRARRGRRRRRRRRRSVSP